MLTHDIQKLKDLRRDNTRLLGLDVGDRTVGVSLSDTRWQISTPMKTLKRQGTTRDVRELVDIVREYEIAGIVIGWPLNMDGSQGPQAKKTEVFAQALAEALDIPVLLWDERWSTLAASRAMLEADLSRKKRDKLIDQVAASYILQGVLDSLNRGEVR